MCKDESDGHPTIGRLEFLLSPLELCYSCFLFLPLMSLIVWISVFILMFVFIIKQHMTDWLTWSFSGKSGCGCVIWEVQIPALKQKWMREKTTFHVSSDCGSWLWECECQRTSDNDGCVKFIGFLFHTLSLWPSDEHWTPRCKWTLPAIYSERWHASWVDGGSGNGWSPQRCRRSQDSASVTLESIK